jgi:TetR/AcrR family transcriptional regulator, transcriptional repressor for nem operon
MRYTKDHKQETHDRIVLKAGERFRAEGVDAVGVASLMGSLGLTVGGFYAHFDSKQALVAEACSDGFARTTAAFRELVQSRPKGERLSAVIDAYLSKRHRDEPEQGCFAAANGAELARHPVETRAAFTQQLNAWIAMIDEAMKADGLTGDAQGVASAMVGTMTLARAVDDPVLSDAFLESGRRTIRASLTEAKSKAPVTDSRSRKG